jgi:hypothetical protein
MNLRAVSRIKVHVNIAEVGDGRGGVIFDKAVAASVFVARRTTARPSVRAEKREGGAEELVGSLHEPEKKREIVIQAPAAG